MSALPPIADIRWCGWDVRKVPEAELILWVCPLPSVVVPSSFGAGPLSRRARQPVTGRHG
jgi:hypothetical protein